MQLYIKYILYSLEKHQNNHFNDLKQSDRRKQAGIVVLEIILEASKDIDPKPLLYFIVMIHMHPLSPAIMLSDKENSSQLSL